MREIIRRGVVPVAIVAAMASALATTPVARADDRAGAFRIGADLHVLNLRHYPDPDQPNPPDPTVAFGLYNAVGGTEEFLFFAPQFGYMLTDSIVIGAHLGLAVVSFSGSDPGFGIHIVPFFEYLFGEGSNVRPFVSAQVGPRIFTLPDFRGGNETYVNLVAGGGGGVHIFVEDSFSISPFATVDFLYNSQAERGGYEIILGVSLEGWIGGGT